LFSLGWDIPAKFIIISGCHPVKAPKFPLLTFSGIIIVMGGVADEAKMG
jgi:hypothetical protein